jgi:aspartyl-tRNA(Asn)/glutamyl-tRNA(Gln) amidotransferase subunit C
MKVTDKDVSYVAALANLELTDQERQRMLKDLNSILGHINLLNELDTTNIPPMAQVSGASSGDQSSHLREDALIPCLPHANAMENAPETDGEFFKVPKVIEK